MEYLKIIVSKARAFAGTDFSRYEKLIAKAIKSGHTVSTISYIHGVVEESMGYDIGACLNAELLLDNKGELLEGIYNAKVIGYAYPCTAYLWKSINGKSRCLIVDSTCTDDVLYATKQYSARTDDL